MGLSFLKFSLIYCTCASHSAVLLSSFMRTVERMNTSLYTFPSSLKGFQLRRTSNYIFFNGELFHYSTPDAKPLNNYVVGLYLYLEIF
jgi:hypothetical protein